MKKKLLFYLLVGCMCLSMAACGKKVEKDNSATVSTEESSSDDSTVTKDEAVNDDSAATAEESSSNNTAVMRDEYSLKYDACVAQTEEIEYSLENVDLTQTEINTKSMELYELLDGHLNYLWGVLKASLTEDEFSKLATEEKQWVQNKEAAMNEAAADYEGGSIQSYIYNSKGTELTKKRVEELQVYLK